MQKLLSACLLLVIIVALQSKAFAAAPLDCTFKDAAQKMEGIESLQITDESLIVNESHVIQLEHTTIRCRSLGRQHRFDGSGVGLQIILKSCSAIAVLEGQLIDAANAKIADVVCVEAKP